MVNSMDNSSPVTDQKIPSSPPPAFSPPANSTEEKPLIVQSAEVSSPSEPQVFSSSPRKPRFPSKALLLGFVIALVFGGVGLGIYFIQKGNFSLLFKAETGSGLICTPIDGSGASTDDVCDNQRIKVTNSTSSTVHLVWQYNFCPLSLAGSCPSACLDQATLVKTPDVVAPGQSKIYSVDVPCNMYGQFDVYQNKDIYPNEPQCTHADGRPWIAPREGGPAIAYTFSKGATVCPSPTPTPAACANCLDDCGTYLPECCDGFFCEQATGKCIKTCPEGQVFDPWYETCTCITRTTTTTPQPTPTGPQASCLSLAAFELETDPPSLENLKVGDTIRFSLTPSGDMAAVEAAAIRLFKNGTKVGDLPATLSEGKWILNYSIPVGGAGSYEAFGFIKIGDLWK